jgi:hypothetical protein
LRAHLAIAPYLKELGIHLILKPLHVAPLRLRHHSRLAVLVHSPLTQKRQLLRLFLLLLLLDQVFVVLIHF